MIHGVKVKHLRANADERGYLMEILREDDEIYERFGQVYVSLNYPGIIRAWHYHLKQTDYFVCLKGMIKVPLYDARPDSPTRGEVNEFFLGEKNPILLVIPNLVLHGMKGIGTTPALMINIPT